MPFTRQLTAVVGTWLCLWFMGGAVRADPWYWEHGMASYYGKGFHGRKTASGERFSQNEMTAAHRQLPLGTKVMVENPETGAQIEVKITDRGPYADMKRRIIDLSKRQPTVSASSSQGWLQSVSLSQKKPPSSRRVLRKHSSMRSRWALLNTTTRRRAYSPKSRTGFLRRIWRRARGRPASITASESGLFRPRQRPSTSPVG